MTFENWKNWVKDYPYKGVNDPEYIKERDATFLKNGHGWWWEWTKVNTPIPGIFSPKDDKRCGGDRGAAKVGRPPKEDFTDDRNR